MAPPLFQTRFEANAELFSTRKKFFESSLDYYSELNCFQHKRKFAILEPLLTFMHAQVRAGAGTRAQVRLARAGLGLVLGPGLVQG